MSNYRYKPYKETSSVDWAYDDSENVIHFKFGDMRKNYNFTEDFRTKHPMFCKEYARYFAGESSLFTDPLTIVNYIETFNLPVRLYSNMVDEEFEDIQAAKEWICAEYSGNRDKLYKYESGKGWIGIDGEGSK